MSNVWRFLFLIKSLGEMSPGKVLILSLIKRIEANFVNEIRQRK